MVALDRVETESDAVLIPALLAEQLGRELGALADVDAAVRGLVIEADVVEETRDQQQLAVDRPRPARSRGDRRSGRHEAHGAPSGRRSRR